MEPASSSKGAATGPAQGRRFHCVGTVQATGQPFFLAAGFRKPHLAFRFPAPFLQRVAADVAAHGSLSATVPPIAHMDVNPQAT